LTGLNLQLQAQARLSMDNNRRADGCPVVYPLAVSNRYTNATMRTVNIAKPAQRSPIITMNGVAAIEVVYPRYIGLEVICAISILAFHILLNVFSLNLVLTQNCRCGWRPRRSKEGFDQFGFFVNIHFFLSDVFFNPLRIIAGCNRFVG